MADLDLRRGDTWPPLRFRLEDDDGLMPVADADEIRVYIEGPDSIEGVAEAIDPPEEDGEGNKFNARYVWAATDLDATEGEYRSEAQITWDATSSPPKIQTVPNKFTAMPTVEVHPRLVVGA